MTEYLTTDSGDYVLTESGQQIVVTRPSDAQTIQQFDYSVDLLRALLWQYNDAKNLQGLLNAKAIWYLNNQTDFWENWYVDVFNLATANQFGLIVWGYILGFSLYVNTLPYSDQPTWGFASDDVNFDNGNFNDTGGSSTLLPLPIQRIALQLRYFQLTSSGTVPEINRMLKFVFSAYGKAWLRDNLDMTQEYVFDFALPSEMRFLFDNYDILPRPAGVQSGYVDATLSYFAFDGAGNNFDNGNGFGD